jgi:hypothetical protein
MMQVRQVLQGMLLELLFVTLTSHIQYDQNASSIIQYITAFICQACCSMICWQQAALQVPLAAAGAATER